MGPQCPHCGSVYEWTCGELEEQVTAPKVYFCQDCRGLFILTPDEIEVLQERFRPALEEADRAEPCDEPADPSDDEDAQQPRALPSPVRAHAKPSVEEDEDELEDEDEDEDEGPEPLLLRDRVRVVRGPHEGIIGAVAVIDNEQILLRVEGRNSCVRVSVSQLQRAA